MNANTRHAGDKWLPLDDALEEMVSAEEFLEYFGIAFDQAVVHVNRLHIMQRFHDYIEKAGAPAGTPAERREACKTWLARAYTDFVESDALTEKVFKVFRMNEPQKTFVSVDQLLG